MLSLCTYRMEDVWILESSNPLLTSEVSVESGFAYNLLWEMDNKQKHVGQSQREGGLLG